MRASAPIVLAAVSIIGLISGCSAAEPGSSPQPERVIVGAGSSDISVLLAQIYAGGLRSTGADVEVREGLGDRAEYLSALDRGEVTLIPDLTGELLTTFDAQSGATEAEDVFVELNRSLPPGLSVGDYALAEDRIAIAVAPDSQASGGTVADFAAQEGSVVGVVDGRVDPEAIADGFSRALIASDDGVFTGATATDIMVYPDADTAVEELDSGAVAALAIRTASFGPGAKDLTTLPDDDSAFTAQNVVPLYRNGTLSDNEIRAFGVVAGELTTADLADMIGEVRSGGASGDVASRWLGEHSL